MAALAAKIHGADLLSPRDRQQAPGNVRGTASSRRASWLRARMVTVPSSSQCYRVGSGERPGHGTASSPAPWSPGSPGVTTSAPLATWDKRHFLHSLSPSSSCPGPRGLPIRPALPQLCPEALDQPHPLGLELNQNLVTIPASAHRLLAPRAANVGWAATAPGQDGAASGAHPHGGDHPCGSPPPALQAGKWHTAGGEEREACHLVICARQPSPGRSTVRSAVGPLG